ncbi:anaerobic dehydrogenase [Clostridium pasteurianum DSM 525 = ATCC 6013]|uniref:Anaerobic dehydrogenase n=1 Tax=Clostridium pasteurianum DSM 525 = ATCC 6013 TaxID=1262449 RepID=A0A0H3J025_CLOPA|nr:molybdopterin-dependent oxidoreductase [Clostridium pasteurianum]AJA47166.1 anaerobic dehydrogenase [Clostridium pasteurianum DSM 525 = ATCC 6013]AJA51154.1 anaerobic dehydrogenase [Clostridium pasteurianum DSM 525 = ATCC 6013]AOZ74524.1 molybdopterin oxidoreductase [Clostridium pasteurianum DSM 525 = ATCC 6013]AOZ78321.1 molybdopterin oxidoreductase [Clostridium pasteurianum]ELP59447.1 anaerobic dehydrogenase [Clostridium pasteurianum DSM 525 = ATCC 6013]
MKQKIIKTTCTRDCPNTCGLLAVVENNRVVKLTGNKEHPINEGRSCIKCSHYLERVYNKERVLHPLKKVNGKFKRISWEEALDEIADKMKKICKVKTPESILYYQGFGARTALKLVNRRFFNLLGNTTITKGTICGGTGQGSQDLDFGNRISHDPRDYGNSNSMILWGRNPAATGINLLSRMTNIKKRGGRVILIDPVNTETAPLCSMHIKPKAGSDSYLALALSRILHDEGAEDKEFLKEHCINYEEYKKIVYSHTVDEYSELCDVPVEQILEAAEVIKHMKPTAFVLGWGLHRWEYAHTTLRAIDALGAAAGSIGVSGGGVSQGFEEYAPYDWNIWGDQLQPKRRKFYMQLLGEELNKADPKIEIAMITAGNPVSMLPDANAVKKALSQIPFLVVAGHFLDDTGILADIFLPVTTFLEEKDIVAAYGHDFIGPLNQAISPVGECKSDFHIFMELGKRFDFANEYVKPLDQWLKIIMKPTIERGISLEEIFQGGTNNPEAPKVPYEDKKFPTPTGKFQLMKEFELPKGRDQDYPYQLMSIASREWLCSEVTLSEQKELLPMKINQEEGIKLGLKDGDKCIVENQFGSIECIAKFDKTQRRDLVVIPRGGWGQAKRNVNELTRPLVSKVGAGTPYYETRVIVRKMYGR